MLFLCWASVVDSGPTLKQHRYGHGVMVKLGALPMSLPAVRFRIPLGAGISEKYHVSPFSILGHCFDVVSSGKALYPQMLHLTQVKMSTW